MKEKISYGLGDAGYALTVSTVVSFSMFYFTEEVGVAAASLGTILFFTRIIDAITNIVMGHIVDLTDTHEGKTRPWIKRMIVPMMVALIALFSIPDFGSRGTYIYLIIIYNLYFLMYTMSNIPFGTLGTLISRDPEVRSQLNLFRMVSYFGMSIILGIITIPLVNFLGGNQTAWTTVATIYAILMGLIFFNVYKSTKERASENITDKTSKKLGFFKSFSLLLKNKYWLMVFLIMILAWVLVDLFQGVNIYYAEYILGNSNLVGILSGLYTGGLVSGFLIINYPIKKMGRKNTIYLGLLFIVSSSVVLALSPSNVYLVSVATVIRGFSFSPLMGTAYAMLADTIEYGEWKNGIRNEGMTYSGGTFSTTFGSGMASAAIGWLLGASGYISGGTTSQPEEVFSMIRFLFIYAPIIVALVLVVLFYFYKLDNIYDTIIADLNKRKQ